MKQNILLILFIILFKTGFTQQTLPIRNSFNGRYSFKGQSTPSALLGLLGSSIHIEGYDGDELTIDSLATRPSIPEPQDTRGLTNISSIAKYDLPRGISYEAPSQLLYPQGLVLLTYQSSKALIVKVPRNIHLSLSASNSQSEVSKITLKNLTGELEIRGNALVTELNNVTGPVTITSNTIVGSKIIINNLKWPNTTVNAKPLINITTYTADVDISIPEMAKASININTTNGGEVYSNLNLVSKKPASTSFSGSLNGGGPTITINTKYGNVFLRKQK